MACRQPRLFRPIVTGPCWKEEFAATSPSDKGSAHVRDLTWYRTRLYMCLDMLNADASGKASINIYPSIREIPSDGTTEAFPSPDLKFVLMFAHPQLRFHILVYGFTLASVTTANHNNGLPHG
jgi:hypothetical protein